MKIDKFKMERAQSLYENLVDYNLSESGVMPLRLEELLDDETGASSILSTKLSYPWQNGSPELREHIAGFYGIEPAGVTVTSGTSEAIFVCMWGLLERRDRAAVMMPNYMQAWGLARHFGGRTDRYRMVRRKENGRERWALDADSLQRAVTGKTRLILVTNPNNPTGGVLTEPEMETVVRIARRAGAWIVADEVYRGAELSGGLSPTFSGRYARTLIVSGLSKAFGLPGLRIGWIAGPPNTVARLTSYRDYTTLTPTTLGDRLASIAMEPRRREWILRRTRKIVRTQLPRLEEWIRGRADVSYVPPVAGAIAMVGYRSPISSFKLFERLRVEQSVLITPGDHFGMPGRYFRVGYGYDIEQTMKGLERVGRVLDESSR